jgi:hypothetical protein
MELNIGVVHTAKELTIELEGSVDDVVAMFDDAMKSGAPIVWLIDAKGRRVGAPTDKIAYLEINDNGSARRVGFGR